MKNAGDSQLARIRREARIRYHGRRSNDSEIAEAILAAAPDLARAHFRKAVRRLEEFFETSLDVPGAQAARDVIEKIHIITGDRRRERK